MNDKKPKENQETKETKDEELSLEDLDKVSGGSLKDIIDFESGGGGDW